MAQIPRHFSHQHDYSSRLIYLVSFLIPALTVFLYFLVQKTFPFGHHTLLTTDLGQEYIDFYSYYRRVILGHPDQLMYTFSSSLGGPMLGTWSYYLLSPFNLLMLLTPGKWLPAGVWLITILKLGSCGLTMAIYLNHHRPQLSRLLKIALAVAYALCGYNTAYQLNIMWLDGVYLLPLLLLSLEYLVKKQRWWPYFLTLAFSLFTNYYIGYMLCLFSILYFAYLLLIRHPFKPKLGQNILAFAGGSIAAGLINAWLLIPTYLELKTTKATYNAISIHWNVEYNPLKLLTKLANGSYSFDQMSSGQANIFTGGLVLLLALLFFLQPQIAWRQKLTAGLMSLFLIASFFIEPLDLLWHGGQFPVWYPSRFSFIFSAWLIVLASEALCQRVALKLWQLTVIGGSLIAWCAYLLLNTSTYEYLTINNATVSVVIGIASFFLLIFYFSPQRSQILLIVMSLVLIGDSIANYRASLDQISYTDQSEYWNYTAIVNDAVKKLPTNRLTTSRLEKTFNRTNDDPMQFGYAGGAHFNSMQNPIIGRFYDKIGQAAGDNFVNYKYGTMVTDSLLGFKTWLDRDPDNDLLPAVSGLQAGLSISSWRPDVQNYPLTTQSGPIFIRNNPQALNLVFGADQAILKTKLTTGQPILNQERIVNDLVSSQSYHTLFRTVNFEQVNLVNVKRNAQIPDATYTKTKNDLPASVTFTFKPTTNDAYYLSLGSNVNDEQVDVTVSGDHVPINENFRDTILLNVANREINKTVKIQISFKKPSVWLQALSLYQLDNAAVKQAFTQLQKRNAKLTQVSGATVKGMLTTESGQVLMTTIPDNEGWQLTVDGKKLPLEKTLDTFLSAKLSAGKHHFELHYEPNGWRLGWVITCLTAISLIIFCLIQRRRTRYHHRH